MNLAPATAAVLLLAMIGIHGAEAQTVKPAEPITIGNVPANIQVPAGNNAFLLGHGVGTQDYVCLFSGHDFHFALFTPQATLFSDSNEQVVTHYFSPNPFENGTVRVTWQHSLDTSAVWGKVAQSSTDPNFVAPGAIAWLLVQRVGSEDGPTGGNTLTKTSFIQRLNTSGGVAPSTGCSEATDIGNHAFVPYKADYVFYTDH